MGYVATILPLVIQAFEMAPKLIKTGKEVYEGAKQIWEGVTSEHRPTAEEQAAYDDAEKTFDALMKSTDDVKDE